MIVNAISLGYHDVVEFGPASETSLRQAPQRYTLNRSAFRKHLEAIARHAGKSSVSTIEACSGGNPRQSIFLTFDDGGAGSYTCAAGELERFGWRGHFLITTNWIGRPGFMDGAQIRELRARGHIVGSHTASHPSRMSHLEWDQLVAEWTESCRVLEDILGEPVIAGSVADGYYSRRVAEGAAIVGIQYLFNSEPTDSVFRVKTCTVLGRYSIKSGAKPELSGRIAAGAFVPRWRQALFWNCAKAAKGLTGEHYLTIRKAILS